MPEQALISDSVTISALQSLLDLARTASEAPLRQVLEVAGEAIAMFTGFRVVYMNIYRPEYDDYAAMFAHGRPGLSEAPAPGISRDFLARLPAAPVQRARHLFRRRYTRNVGR